MRPFRRFFVSREHLPTGRVRMSSDLRANRPENAGTVRPEAGVDLARLKRGQCRYPVGELQPRRLPYCGKPSLPGKSWCAAHRRLCVSA
jgi:hypothetical protein